VCKLQGGLQRKTTNSKWVHIVCALYSEEWAVCDFKTMEIGPEIEKNRPGKKVRSQRKKCDYCKVSDNVVQCYNPDCGLYAHFYCALRNKVPFLLEEEETRSGWTPYFDTIKVDDIWASFEAGDEKLKYEILVLYKQCEKAINGLDEPELSKNESSMIEETKVEPNKSKKKGGASKKKATKKAGNSSTTEEKAIKEEVKMDIEEPVNPEAAKDPMFIELYEKLQTRISELLANRQKSSNLRGGRMYFECPMHRSEDLLCFCKKPYDATLFMIRCDCCANWFHGSCVGVNPEEGDVLPEYFCQSCREWYRYKLSSLFPSSVKFTNTFRQMSLFYFL
jgi:hypothetical protein